MTSRPLWTLAGVLGVLGATAMGACIEDDVPNYPILLDPCDGGTCFSISSVGVGATSTASSSSSGSSGTSASGSSSSTASSSSASGSSGTGGSTSTSDVSGTVHRVSQPTFVEDTSVYTSALTIELFPASGTQQNIAYGADAGTGFDATGVASGKAWLVALDGSMGAAGIWSTVSAVDVPRIAPVALPVLDAAMIQSLAQSLPAVGSGGVSPNAAHLVLMVTHGGQQLSGAQVTGATGGATIAYDTGPGTYSDTATATGSAGVILLLNSSLSGMTSISVTSVSPSNTTAVPVFTSPGVFTVVSVKL